MNSIIEQRAEKPLLLIIDDSAENLQVLNALLKDDYRLKLAKSGAKGIEIAQQNPQPDLILLDVIMPEMDGFQVCENLKANPQTSPIPVIFLTALNEVADETNGFRKGGSDFITKPFNPDIVKARISTHIELQRERKKSNELLRVLLPDAVVNDLIQHGVHKPQIKENVSILFCDFVGFTSISAQLTPEELIRELSEIFSAFDSICEENKTTRIKTIGDAYMAVSGIHAPADEHAEQLVSTALSFIEFLENRNRQSAQHWRCRIGVHSGKVIAGIIGKTRFIYDVVGDDVNIAARIESAGTPMAVTISPATLSMIGNRFETISAGISNLKGKGEMELFKVNGRAY
jgi:class 3 adenylate cyclase